jgi:hypothetical protein
VRGCFARPAGACIKLLPALFSETRGAKLQDDLRLLRLLYVLFGFLLRRDRVSFASVSEFNLNFQEA